MRFLLNGATVIQVPFTVVEVSDRGGPDGLKGSPRTTASKWVTLMSKHLGISTSTP